LTKIAVLGSGGVDSSVAIALLKEQGYDVTVFYLKIWLEDELAFLGKCPWQQDLEYLEQVCTSLQVPLKVLPMQKEYFKKVVGYTISEIESGRTPNPDVMCNNHIKFGFFLESLPQDFEYVASGHYAQIAEFKHHKCLKMSPDLVKDQSYFLAQIPHKLLEKIVFPIGHLSKPEVRKLAEKYNLANKDRKDSQGICFLGKLKFNDFVEHYLGNKPGNIIEFETGKVMGKHNGFYYHTRGQRKGLGLSGGPWYVVSKDTKKNIVYVSCNYDSLADSRSEFKIESAGNFVVEDWHQQANLRVKLRHGPTLYKCVVQANANGFQVKIDGSDQGIAAGQFAVFYIDDLCLGSAKIIEN